MAFGLTNLVWGINQYKVRNLCQIQKLSLLTTGFFVASGVVILSVFYSNIGLALSIVNFLFASIVFWILDQILDRFFVCSTLQKLVLVTRETLLNNWRKQ